MKNETTLKYSSLLSSLIMSLLVFGIIMPITENNDTLFYICAAIIGGLFLATLAMAVVVFRRDKQALLASLVGNVGDGVLFVAIIVAGMLVDYAIGHSKSAYFWGGILAIYLFAWLLPTPKQTGQPQHDEAA